MSDIKVLLSIHPFGGWCVERNSPYVQNIKTLPNQNPQSLNPKTVFAVNSVEHQSMVLPANKISEAVKVN